MVQAHPVGTIDQTATRNNRTIDLIYLAVDIALTIYVATHLWHALYFNNDDVRTFYSLWLRHIVAFGRWHSLEGAYANYNPPYLYMLSFFSLLHGKVQDVAIIKLVQVPATLAAGYLSWSICRHFGATNLRSLLGGWLVTVAPETFANTLLWGQCDMIHTAWLLLAVRLLLAKRANWAMFVFGIAVAFKLQAIFAGPVFLALLLAGEIPWTSVLFSFLGYVVMMVPAALAGRPWKDLLFGVYQSQMGTDPLIVMHAANFYEFVLTRTAGQPGRYATVFHAGLAITALATIALIVFLVRFPWAMRGWRLVAAIGFTLLMEPFLLPKMHERYFFAGDLFLLVMAMIVPKFAIPAAMLQTAAIIAYQTYFQGVPRDPSYYTPAIALVSIAIVLSAAFWLKRGGQQAHSDEARSLRSGSPVLPL